MNTFNKALEKKKQCRHSAYKFHVKNHCSETVAVIKTQNYFFKAQILQTSTRPPHSDKS